MRVGAKRVSLLAFFFVAVHWCPPSRADWKLLLPASGGTVNQIVWGGGGLVYINTNIGLFKSADSGQTWSPISAGLPVTSASALAADPNLPGVVYAANTVGLFKSTDGGSSWSQLGLATTATIQLIAVAPTNSNYIFVATWNDYVYRSLDGGATWSQSTQGLTATPNAGYMTSIAVDPTNENHVYTSAWRGRLFCSVDAGATWSQLSDSRTWANGQIYVAPSNPNVLYTTFDATWFGYTSVLTSTDAGNTWSTAGNPGGITEGIIQLAIHPSNPNTVFATTDQGVYETTNGTASGGAGWNLVLTPSPASGFPCVAINPSNPSQVYVGSDNYGLYRSLDGGSSWSPPNAGIAGASITSVQSSMPLTMYAVIQTVGIVKSTDGGTTWNLIGANGVFQNAGIGGLGVDPQDPNGNIFVTCASSSQGAHIYRSADGGSSVAAVDNGRCSGLFRFNPHNDNLVSAPISDWQGGFLLSMDNGQSWAVPDWHYIYTNDYVFHPTLSNVVLTVGDQYTGAPADTIYVLWSNASGSAPWNMSSAMGQGYCRTLALDQTDPTTLYVAGNMTDGTQGIYKFTITYDSQNQNIVSVSRVPGTFDSGLTDLTVNQLLYDDAQGCLYAATPSGVFRSSDQAASWTSISAAQVPDLTAQAMTITPDDKLLVGAGSGIWQYTNTPAQPGQASLSTTLLAFGFQKTGTSSSPVPVTLTNIGSGPLAITGIAVSGPNASDFTLAADACAPPAQLAPYAGCEVDVIFTPSAPTPEGAKLIFTDDSGGTPNTQQTVNLTGTGAAPVAGVSPGSLTFGNQDVGTTSPPQAVALSNTGTAPLNVSSIATSGDFAQSNNCGGSVSAGSSCTINVTFTPTATGARSGTLTIADNSKGVSGSQQTVALAGTGTSPGARLSSTSLSFGNQVINTTSAAKKVVLTSTGTSNLDISSVTVTGANGGDFALTNNCPSSLAPGAKCSVDVTFMASMLGAESATLNVNDNAANSPQTVALSGTGVAPATLAPASAGFGNVAINTPSDAKNFTLRNNQTAVLNISSIVLSSPDFTQTNTCGSSVAPKSTCAISVTLTPSALGAESGTLTVNEDAPTGYNALTASLAGTGIADATLTPAVANFGNVAINTPSDTKTLTLKNNQLVALNISNITFSNGDFTQTNSCGASLAAKGSCTISVTLAPSALGTDSATLTVSTDAPAPSLTAALSGTGVAQVTVSPALLTFAKQTVGSTSAEKTVTLKSNLLTALNIGSVTFTGANPGDFAETDNCVGSLAAKSSCIITVTFTPGAAGIRTATLNVIDSANNTPQTVSLTGTGK